MTDEEEIKKAISDLSPWRKHQRNRALLSGYADEKCSVCKKILLAHITVLPCQQAKDNKCPHSAGPVVKSYYDRLNQE